MLGKLLKYDLKWIYRVIVVFYALALIFAVIGRGLSLIENSLIFGIISKICYGVSIAMFVNAVINTLMRVWARTVRNVYKDEAYLTHTLPVEKSKIYLSKFIAAIITMFTSVLVSIVCIAICYYTPENMEILKNMLEIAANTYNSTVIELLLIIFSVFFLEMLFILVVGLVGIIIGHKSSNNKIAKSIIYAFAMYMITQVISLVVVFLFGTFNPDIMNLINTIDTINVDILKLIAYSANALYLIYIIIYYIIGKKQFEKGVNVE